MTSVRPAHNSGGRLRLLSCELSLTDHCNLRCASCNHASPHMPRKFADPGQIARDIDALAQVVHADEIRLAGGEPLLHPRLVDVVATVRDSGIADKITLISNGTLLRRAPAELWRQVDRLWISVYPGTRPQLNAVEQIERAGVMVWHKRTDAFRLTFLNHENRDERLVRSLYKQCRMAHDWACNLIHDGRFYKCVVAPFIAARVRLAGISLDNRHADSVGLHDHPDLRGTIARYLESAEPLQACSYCLGTCGKSMRHHLLDRAGLERERSEDHCDPKRLLSRRSRLIGELSYHIRGNRLLHRLKWWLRFGGQVSAVPRDRAAKR